MIRNDRRGVPTTASSAAALERYELALELVHGYRGDPLGAAAEALAADPELIMAHCLKAGVLAMATDRRLVPDLAREVAAAERLAPGAHDRERRHVAAARAWLDGDLDGAVRLYGDISVSYPRDALALQLAHLGDFYLGHTSLQRDRVARVLPAWNEGVPGFGYVLGMYAFGLEENGDYAGAEATGLRAVEIQPRDPWAVHAVAHVHEMRGEPQAGIAWLRSREADWSRGSSMAVHNSWHLALYHLAVDDAASALAVFDGAIWPRRSDAVLEMIDAAALLWRCHLRGVDVGSRWRALADAWETTIDDGFYAFNDVHAMMALVADGRRAAAGALLETLERSAAGAGTNARLAREVGLPVCRALRAFGDGDHRAAAAELTAVLPVAHAIGGSHAQRDVLRLTLARALGVAPLDRNPTPAW